MSALLVVAVKAVVVVALAVALPPTAGEARSQARSGTTGAKLANAPPGVPP